MSLIAMQLYTAVAAALILGLALASASQVSATGAWSAVYRVEVYARGQASPRTYTLRIGGVDSKVAEPAVSPEDMLGRLAATLAMYPDPSHFYLGSEAVEKLAGWKTLRLGDSVYRPLFTAVAYGVRGKSVMGVLVSIEGPQGSKRAIYDSRSGLLLEEEFSVPGVPQGALRVVLRLVNIEGVELAYIESPAPRQAVILVYAASAIILLSATITILQRYRFAVA